jgi:hypothetical protein
MLYLKALVCKALFREFSHYAAVSDNAIDLSYFEWGLHERVGALSKVLQEEINRIDAGDDIHTSYPPYGLPFDGILIGYGLCSNAVVGLSSQKYPLVIPRAHDCITLLLGSRERYSELFAEAGGTFWLSPGWVESSRIPSAGDREWLYKKLCERYDEQSALMMADINEGILENYSRLALIEWPEFVGREFSKRTKEITYESSQYTGMHCEVIEGSSNLIQALLSGSWDSERFLVVPPGKTVRASYDESVITF